MKTLLLTLLLSATLTGSIYDFKVPGLLGNEIDLAQFKGKKIFDENGNFTSIKVLKGASKILTPEQLVHGVDAISGGTITSNGVSEMIQSNMTNYLEYIKKQKI